MATGCAKEALTAQELWTNVWEERHSFRVTRDLATAIFFATVPLYVAHTAFHEADGTCSMP